MWLEECGRKKLIVVTLDTNILKVPLSMRAIGKTKGRVFFLSSNTVPSEVWANAITSAWREINAVLAKHRGPFYARVSLSGLVWGVTELTSLGREKKKRKAKRAIAEAASNPNFPLLCRNGGMAAGNDLVALS